MAWIFSVVTFQNMLNVSWQITVVPTMVKQGSWDPEHISASVFWSLLWGKEHPTGAGMGREWSQRCQITVVTGTLLSTRGLLETCLERFTKIEIWEGKWLEPRGSFQSGGGGFVNFALYYMRTWNFWQQTSWEQIKDLTNRFSFKSVKFFEETISVNQEWLLDVIKYHLTVTSLAGGWWWLCVSCTGSFKSVQRLKKIKGVAGHSKLLLFWERI